MANELINSGSMKAFPEFYYTIGILPSSYKISLTYEEQLEEVMKFIRDEIIPKFNQNSAALGELQEKFVELVQYVDDYFSELNLQSEVDTKLEEMVEDGTLAEIINQEIFGQINEDITSLKSFQNTMTTTTIPNLTERVAANETSINDLENKLLPLKENNKKYQKLNLPTNFRNSFFDKVNVFWNGKDFKYNHDEFHAENKTNILYVAPDGNNSNAGTYDSPKKSVNNCLSYFVGQAITNGTIILKNGVYFYGDVSTLINHSCTIKPEEKGKVFITTSSSAIVFSLLENYTYTYHTTRSNSLTCIDLTTKIPLKMKAVNSIAEVEAEQGTYYINGNDVYVHMNNNVVPTKNNCIIPLRRNLVIIKKLYRRNRRH